MNKCLNLLYVIAAGLSFSHAGLSQTELPQARILNIAVEPDQVVVLHLRPGYISSVRVLEDVSSVVLGDPGSFNAEHSDDEPQLVFFKATSLKPAQTNALITTKSGREISLSLVSRGKSGGSEVVDYVLKWERPRSFLISLSPSSFVIADTKDVASNTPAAHPSAKSADQGAKIERLESPDWKGKQLRIAVGQSEEKEQQMTVPFAVLNSSTRTIELLPPQIELAGSSRDKHRKSIKAEPVPIQDYRITSRRLSPGTRADGFVVFDRPNFKESNEGLLLSIAQAEEADRPVRTPIAFVAPIAGGAK
jgi:hypothetical protein